MVPIDLLDRELTKEENAFIEKLAKYPVQFKDIHLHKDDS
jgi:hypothetical protein